MDKKNITRFTTIQLVGFETHPRIGYLIFFILFMVYCLATCGNLLIITLVAYSPSLHSPMYFFLSQLAVSDIVVVTSILPSMLHAILVKENKVSFSSCIAQLYFFSTSEFVQFLLLTVMSYDRYLAICRPLHYNLIMSHRVCWIVVVIVWTLSAAIEFMGTFMVSNLQFCGSNIIDHFFCDVSPIMRLSCSDNTEFKLLVDVLGAVFVVVPFFIIIVSYIYIIITILNIPSITARKKVFSTCSSHLTVVSIFYVTIVCVYLVPNRKQSWDNSKFLSLLYVVVTPLLNPIIYSLRNKDLNQVVETIINHFFSLCSYSR